MYKVLNPQLGSTKCSFKRNTSTRKYAQIPLKKVSSMRAQKKQKNKSVQLPSKKRNKSIQPQKKIVIDSSNMKTYIQQQKIIDLEKIHQSVALTHYYQSLLSLFSVIYSSSQIITSNIFQNKKLCTGLSGLKFVGVLFSIYQFVWNQINTIKLKTIAKNVMKMGSTINIFQQKVQFICRKVTLNFNVQKRIQMAFLNTNLDSFWNSLLTRFKLTDQVQILQQMYQTAPQKLAYWDFNYFVGNYLTDQKFYNLIKQSKNQSIKTQQNHNFTYQFLLIQIFIFHQEEIDRERQQNLEIKQKNCQII